MVEPELKLQFRRDACRLEVSVLLTLSSALTSALLRLSPDVTPVMATELTSAVRIFVVSASYWERLPVTVRPALVSLTRAVLTVVSRVPTQVVRVGS